VRHERVAFARREHSHRRRFPVALVLVEDRQIRLDTLAQDAHATSVPPSLRSTIGEASAGARRPVPVASIAIHDDPARFGGTSDE